MPGDRPLKHNPFAALSNQRSTRSAPPAKRVETPTKPLSRIIVREEFDPEVDGFVARIIGVPQERLRASGAKLRSALGVTVYIEGRELLVTSNDLVRIAAWFEEQGAEVVMVERPKHSGLQSAGRPGGTLRSEIRRGLHVAIVLKADQDTGALTEGHRA